MEDDGATPKPKKQRSAFTIGPDNLPDGTYRRKGKYTSSANPTITSLIHSF
jgi:hypothetical protein